MRKKKRQHSGRLTGRPSAGGLMIQPKVRVLFDDIQLCQNSVRILGGVRGREGGRNLLQIPIQ